MVGDIDSRISRLEVTQSRILARADAAGQSAPNNIGTYISTWDQSSTAIPFLLGPGISLVSGSRFTVARSCVVLATANVWFAPNATGYREVSIMVNAGFAYGDVITAPVTVAGIRTAITTSAVVVLAAGDYVELRCAQTSGGALNVDESMLTLIAIQ